MKEIKEIDDLQLIRAGTYVLWSDNREPAFILEVVHGNTFIEPGDNPRFSYLYSQYKINNCPELVKINIGVSRPHTFSSLFYNYNGYVSEDIHELIDLIPVNLVIHNSDLIRAALERAAGELE